MSDVEHGDMVISQDGELFEFTVVSNGPMSLPSSMGCDDLDDLVVVKQPLCVGVNGGGEKAKELVNMAENYGFLNSLRSGKYSKMDGFKLDPLVPPAILNISKDYDVFYPERGAQIKKYLEHHGDADES
jgi:hypothetical protein